MTDGWRRMKCKTDSAEREALQQCISVGQQHRGAFLSHLCEFRSVHACVCRLVVSDECLNNKK